MKPLHSLLFLSISVFLLLSSCLTRKQKNSDEPKVFVDNTHHFTFLAQSAQPLGDAMLNKVQQMLPPGSNVSNINLNGQYWIKFGPDTLNCYLPYYGRAFTSAYGTSTKSVLDFKSSDFKRVDNMDKKGQQLIIYYFKNQEDVLRMTIRNSGNGYANVQFQFRQRQPISFYGALTQDKKQITF